MASTTLLALALNDIPTWGWVLIVFGGLIALGRLNQEKGRRKLVKAVNNGSGFTAVAGCAEAIEDLREMVEFLADPETFEHFGATVPKGALLVGPPGTGKTLLARSVAAEAGVPFISANGSDFVEMYVGVGAKRIRELYQEARSHQRAIVFIDEIDAIARRRGGPAGGQTGSGGLVEHENTLIALLTELDGFTENQVITIAATNRPDVLDPAVTRPGRLERRIDVPNPDRNGRRAILQIHTANKPLADDVDLDVVASRTPGMSGAELARVCNEAALTAIRHKHKRIDAACFDAAIELVAIGRERRSATVTERDRRITAWHEAGHATAALLLSTMPDPISVSITPRGPAGGITWIGDDDDQFMTGEQAFGRIMTMLAGRCAEEILLGGGCTQGAANDLQQATELATTLIMRLGMTDHGLSVRDQHDERTVAAVDQLLRRAQEDTRRMLDDEQALLEAIAEDLLTHERLDSHALLRLKAARARSSRIEPRRHLPTTAPSHLDDQPTPTDRSNVVDSMVRPTAASITAGKRLAAKRVIENGDYQKRTGQPARRPAHLGRRSAQLGGRMLRGIGRTVKSAALGRRARRQTG